MDGDSDDISLSSCATFSSDEVDDGEIVHFSFNVDSDGIVRVRVRSDDIGYNDPNFTDTNLLSN